MSDRVHRRSVILVVTLAASLVAGVAAFVDPGGPLILVAMFLFGGLSFPMYSLLLSHVNDMLPAGQAVAASSVFVFVTGVGAIFGPLAGALAIERLGAVGFWWIFVLVHVGIGVFSVFRISMRAAIPVDQQGRFIESPARASAVVASITSRSIRKRNGKVNGTS